MLREGHKDRQKLEEIAELVWILSIWDSVTRSSAPSILIPRLVPLSLGAQQQPFAITSHLLPRTVSPSFTKRHAIRIPSCRSFCTCNIRKSLIPLFLPSISFPVFVSVDHSCTFPSSIRDFPFPPVSRILIGRHREIHHINDKKHKG